MMGESQLSRLAGLLQLSKHHRESWKAMQRRSATGNSLRDTSMDMEAQPRQRMLRTSGRMNLGTALSVMGSFVLLIAFCSSHWMESRRQAYSEFVKLGLWEVCFNNYFHHSFQFHYAFSGCHWVYSSEYRLIWEFVMPPWFIAVQGLVTTSLLMSIISLLLLAAVYLELQRNAAATFLWSTIVQNFLTGIFLLIAIVIFGIKAQDQRWMPHQLYNYYGWSYWLAFTSILFHTLSGWILVKEARKRKTTQIVLVHAASVTGVAP